MVAAQKVRDLTTVEAEIATIKEQLLNVKGSETEVYARIVGYYKNFSMVIVKSAIDGIQL